MVLEFFNPALALQIFVLLNPLSSAPILMGAYRKKLNVKKIAFMAVLVAFIVAVSMAVVGPWLFKVFGITLNSFRIAGGIVLLILGINTIKPRQRGDDVTNFESTVSLIATPMLTGPATISFITIKTYELGFFNILLNIIAAFILVGALFIAFAYSVSWVNPKIVDLASRILGFFLIAVSIEMIFKGLSEMVAAMPIFA